MEGETLRTLITCCTTVLVALISNILVFAVTKINNKTSKKDSITEQQYIKVIAPIHKILYFDCIKDDELKYQLIESVISENYHIVPENIRLAFLNVINPKNDIEPFKKKIYICFKYLSSILGYSREKLSSTQIETAKEIINRKSESYKYHKKETTLTVVIVLLEYIIAMLLEYYIVNNYNITSSSFLIVFAFISGLIIFLLNLAFNSIFEKLANKK